MTLQITGKNLDIGEALRTYVEDRIENILDKFAGQSPAGHVRIEKTHGSFLTGCTIQLQSGLFLEAHGEAPDAYASADQSLDRLEKRLRRNKRRIKNRHGPTHKKPADSLAQYYVIQPTDDEENETETETENDDNPLVIAEMQTSIRELSVSDAVMQLDMAEKPLLVFQNASQGRINVVYRREDGNVGWIDPGGQTESTD